MEFGFLRTKETSNSRDIERLGKGTIDQLLPQDMEYGFLRTKKTSNSRDKERLGKGTIDQ